MNSKEFLIGEEDKDRRLDKFLVEKLQAPVSLVSKSIRKKIIRVNGEKTSNNYRLFVGDTVSIKYFVEKNPVTLAENISDIHLKKIKNSIIFEDHNFLIINKPAGMASQGGVGIPKTNTVDSLVKGLNPEYRIVHRLDKETSGLMIIAKDRLVAQELGKLFSEGLIEKTYVAILRGKCSFREKSVENYIQQGEYRKFAYDTPPGQWAKTIIRTEKILEEYSLVYLYPITGRSHQLRIACESIGYPILGDKTYFGEKPGPRTPRMYLHADNLAFHFKGIPYEFHCSTPFIGEFFSGKKNKEQV